MSGEEARSIDRVDDDEGDLGARKRRLVQLLLAYSALLGVWFSFFPEETPMDMLAPLPVLILAITWCFTDAAERKFQLGPMRVLLVLLFFVGFPLYVFRSRGLGGFKTLALCAVLVVAMIACMGAAMFATDLLGTALGIAHSAL